MNDEQLIELVKQHSVLYDMRLAQYRDHNVRNNAWDEIAEQMNTSVEEVRNKWSKLRNCFTNAIKRRRKKSGQAAAKAVPWKLEKQMEFLLPHIKRRYTVTNLSTSNDDDSTPDYEYLFSEEESADSPPPTIRSPTPGTSSLRPSVARASTASFTPRCLSINDNNDNEFNEMVNVTNTTQEQMIQKRAVSDMDENDLFFLSMSKQLKKLPKTDQAEIKFQLHKLIYESEMKMLNDREQQQILNTRIKFE